MTRTALILATAGVAALSSMGTASAQSPTCAPHAAVVQSLAEQYREKSQSIGVVDSKTVIEVFVSDAGTWTIIATDTNGKSCVLSAGEGWENTAVVAGLTEN